MQAAEYLYSEECAAVQAGNRITPKLTIIMPAFNEAQAIKPVLESLLISDFDFVQEIIVVDDGSSDDTAGVAQAVGVRVLRHAQNMGYGAALKTGIRAAQTEFVLTMDADGQHRVEDVQRLWSAVGDDDMVVGQRPGLRQSPFWRMPGKWLLWMLANYLTRHTIPDLNSGLRLIRREISLKYLHICPAGFSFSTTITMALISRGYKVRYVPIAINRRLGKSTVTFKTGLDTIILILRLATLFDPLRLFIPVSVFVGTMGVLWGIPYALLGRGVSVGAMLAIMTAMLFFGLGLLCDQISQLRLERFE
jgi:glycosyltransferase involved in cell wall biosynthesis